MVSWLTWTLLLIVGTSAAFAAHQTKTALLTLGDTFGTGLILVLGLKFGIAKYSFFDGLCQVATIVGLVLWFVFNSPAVAIVAVVLIDLVGSIPTFEHAWVSPSEETWQAFSLMSVASLLTISSLTIFSVASLAYPVYLLLNNSLLASTPVYRRRKLGIALSRSGLYETIR